MPVFSYLTGNRDIHSQPLTKRYSQNVFVICVRYSFHRMRNLDSKKYRTFDPQNYSNAMQWRIQMGRDIRSSCFLQRPRQSCKLMSASTSHPSPICNLVTEVGKAISMADPECILESGEMGYNQGFSKITSGLGLSLLLLFSWIWAI